MAAQRVQGGFFWISVFYSQRRIKSPKCVLASTNRKNKKNDVFDTPQLSGNWWFWRFAKEESTTCFVMLKHCNLEKLSQPNFRALGSWTYVSRDQMFEMGLFEHIFWTHFQLSFDFRTMKARNLSIFGNQMNLLDVCSHVSLCFN